MKTKVSLPICVLLILITLLLATLILPNAPLFPAQGVTHHDNIAATDGAFTTLSGTLTGNVTGDLTGDMTGDLTNSTYINLVSQTSITVTNSAAFTPTGTHQGITAAGEVTPTITAGVTAGNLLILVNSSAQTVNLVDTGTTKLSAAWAGGQYDTLLLMSDGTNWIEISRTNN